MSDTHARWWIVTPESGRTGTMRTSTDLDELIEFPAPSYGGVVGSVDGEPFAIEIPPSDQPRKFRLFAHSLPAWPASIVEVELEELRTWHADYWGAKADGVADDTAAIQAAVAYAQRRP